MPSLRGAFKAAATDLAREETSTLTAAGADGEVLAAALDCKERGNRRLAAKDSAGALNWYKEGLAHLERESLAGGGPRTAVALAVALHSNSAQALLKQRHWLECVDQCHAALRLDPASVKAAWRGATAAIEAGMHDVAVALVENALLEEPQCQELLELRKRLGPLPDAARGGDGWDSGNDEDFDLPTWKAPPSVGAPPLPPRRPPPPPGKDKAD